VKVQTSFQPEGGAYGDHGHHHDHDHNGHQHA
jgi:hypothetical protein